MKKASAFTPGRVKADAFHVKGIDEYCLGLGALAFA
jgi:hypothetical protein